MSKEYCGVITYRGKVYEVHWDKRTYLVFVSKVENPAIQHINYEDFRAESKENACNVALEMLVSALGRNIE